MKANVILEGMGGELDRASVEIADDSETYEADVDNAISSVIENWVLSVGDTIRVVEDC